MKTQTNSDILSLLAICHEACNKIFDPQQPDRDILKLMKCTELCKDAADICHTASVLVSRNSIHSRKILRFSSTVLHRCADELGKYQEFKKLKECSDVCRTTAHECALIS